MSENTRLLVAAIGKNNAGRDTPPTMDWYIRSIVIEQPVEKRNFIPKMQLIIYRLSRCDQNIPGVRIVSARGAPISFRLRFLCPKPKSPILVISMELLAHRP